MRWWLSVSVMLASCAASAGRTEDPASLERGISGVVRFEGAPRPAKFSVSLSDRTVWFTSADGSFRLAVEKDRLATLHFEAPGFASSNVYTAIPERGEAHVDVTLYPACAIRGLVRDAKKDAVPGALVTVAHAEKAFYWGQRPSAQTGADGSFELTDVPPGALYIAAGATGLARSFAGPITVTTGKPQSVEVALAPPVPIRGRVIRSGAPVEGAEVELRLDRPDASRLGLVFAPAETDANGQFAIADSAPGARRLVVRVVEGEGLERGIQHATRVEVSPRGEEKLEVNLTTGATALQISFPSGEPGELLVVQGKIIAERGMDLESLLGTVHYAQVSATDTTARIDHVESGDHTLILMPPPDVRLLPGGCHCMQLQIHVPQGSREMKIDLVGSR